MVILFLPNMNHTRKIKADVNSDDEEFDPEQESLSKEKSVNAIYRSNKEDISSSLGSIQMYFTIFKGMVAIGVLYLPKGFADGGWALSTLAFLACAVFSSEGFNRLIMSHEKVGGNYPALAKKAGGTTLKTLLELALVISQVFSLS